MAGTGFAFTPSSSSASSPFSFGFADPSSASSAPSFGFGSTAQSSAAATTAPAIDFGSTASASATTTTTSFGGASSLFGSSSASAPVSTRFGQCGSNPTANLFGSSSFGFTAAISSPSPATSAPTTGFSFPGASTASSGSTTSSSFSFSKSTGGLTSVSASPTPSTGFSFANTGGASATSQAKPAGFSTMSSSLFSTTPASSTAATTSAAPSAPAASGAASGLTGFTFPTATGTGSTISNTTTTTTSASAPSSGFTGFASQSQTTAALPSIGFPTWTSAATASTIVASSSGITTTTSTTLAPAPKLLPEITGKTVEEFVQSEVAKVVETQGSLERQLELIGSHQNELDNSYGNFHSLSTSVESQSDEVDVVVKTFVKSFPLKIKQSDTLSELKMKIENLEGTPSSQQKIVFAGKELEGEELELPKGCVLFLSRHMSGGGCKKENPTLFDVYEDAVKFHLSALRKKNNSEENAYRKKIAAETAIYNAMKDSGGIEVSSLSDVDTVADITRRYDVSHYDVKVKIKTGDASVRAAVLEQSFNLV